MSELNTNDKFNGDLVSNIPNDDKTNNKIGIALGIIGTRHYNNYRQLVTYLDNKYPPKHNLIHTIVSGGAQGADKLAEHYAHDRGLDTIIHKAEWYRYRCKHTAAWLRNQKIVADSDQIVAFWDGKSPGTKMTIGIAKAAGIPVDIVYYST